MKKLINFFSISIFKENFSEKFVKANFLCCNFRVTDSVPANKIRASQRDPGSKSEGKSVVNI